MSSKIPAVPTACQAVSPAVITRPRPKRVSASRIHLARALRWHRNHQLDSHKSPLRHLLRCLVRKCHSRLYSTSTHKLLRQYWHNKCRLINTITTMVTRMFINSNNPNWQPPSHSIAWPQWHHSSWCGSNWTRWSRNTRGWTSSNNRSHAWRKFPHSFSLDKNKLGKNIVSFFGSPNQLITFDYCRIQIVKTKLALWVGFFGFSKKSGCCFASRNMVGSPGGDWRPSSNPRELQKDEAAVGH